MTPADLNDQQRQIIENGDGVFIIKAGPGTGKTKTLTSRIAYLILNKEVNPQNILALTFTQRAAGEMRQRLRTLLKNTLLPVVTTFHGFAYELLRSLGQKIEIISEEQQNDLIKKIIKENSVKISSADFSLAISNYKNNITKEKFSEGIKKNIDQYNNELSKRDLWDFDDLIYNLFKQLNEDEKFRESVRKVFQYILIDEFQDTNNLQYQIIKLMLNSSLNLFVIGDPSQSVYGFRGATPRIFQKLKDDFPQSREEVLEVSYRSLKNIVEITNLLFGGTINSNFSLPGKVGIIQTLNEYTEAQWIVRFIENKLGGTNMQKARDDGLDERVNFSDFAVIYRTHGLSYNLEHKLNESGMPFQVVKVDSYLEGDHIKLLSMHAAKGLEFKYVFICGFEEGLIPHQRAAGRDDLEEEKRLLYVAMTRAKEELYLLYAKRRDKKPADISRFIRLLQSPNMVKIEDQRTGKMLKKSQISLF